MVQPHMVWDEEMEIGTAAFHQAVVVCGIVEVVAAIDMEEEPGVIGIENDADREATIAMLEVVAAVGDIDKLTIKFVIQKSNCGAKVNWAVTFLLVT
jgi:hypothetical protein